MAKVYKLYVGIIIALALCKYCLAEGNSTDVSANRTVPHCHRHGDRDNCTDTDQWSGHFSKCPEDLRYYCIHGECRYVADQKAPSCRCQFGYEGYRCELLQMDLLKGNRQLIIGCIIAGLVVVILLIVFICICSHRRCRMCRRRRRRREEARNGTERLNMMDTSTTHTTLTPSLTEPLNIISV